MGAPALRYDGLYVEDAVEPLEGGEPGEGSRGYLRFYADGAVVAAASIATAKVAQVWRWLRREDASLAHGIATLEGSAIRFETRSPPPEDVSIEHTGTLSGTQLTLTTTSRWNGRVAERRYTFAPRKG